ncbi:MAG: enoyl-CoA hydratase-related protein [Proteobacteria bacterium]|nr:enoyl-CoA hydratase-related protein [Pseudomonadota bacterium]
MDYSNILFDAADGLATITLNRPEKRNAYTVEMGEEVVHAFRTAREDDAVRAIVLTGAGKGFCAGVDLEALKAHQSGAATTGSGPKLGEEDFLRVLPLELVACPKPILVAIHGAAIGVGMTMTLPCDVRVAAQDAKLALPFAKLGILPGLGSTHLLPRLVGSARARELVLTGKTIRGDEAAAIGLVNHAVPAAEVLDFTRALAADMAAIDPTVLAYAKRALNEGAGATLEDAMKNEQALSAELRSARAKT